MHSLAELRDFLESKEIKIKSYNGWQIVVGKETWGMAHDVIYCGAEPVAKKEILNRAQKCIEEDEVDVKHSSSKTRKWRGISSRNYK
jgi:hypothetical protein